MQDNEDLALIQRVFTDEMMAALFSRLGPYALGRAACVCRQWRFLARVCS
jgi:F-box protein 9